jgi:hypothetical protein
MTWGSGSWGISPWGDAVFPPPPGSVLAFDSADVLAADLILVRFNEPLKVNTALKDPANWIVTPDGAGQAVRVLSVRPGLNVVGTREILLEVTPFTVGEIYTVTASTSFINLDSEVLTIPFNTGKFKGRDTKIDSMVKSRPRMYDTRVSSLLRNILNAIGREDDLIGGSRNDRLP